MRLSNPGEEDDPSKVLVFKEYRLNAQLAGKLHSALGHFLHERQLRDLERGKDVNHQTMRRKAEEAVTELDRVLSSTGFNIRMNHNVRWDCDCGEPCEASISFGQERKRWRCKACSQTYELVSVDDTIRVRLLRSYQNKAPLPSPDWTHHARSFREVRAMKVTDVRWVSEEEPATGSATSDD
ncbi:MAG: hypothetical protein EOP20_05920 [Hyphomicrobiales bacterium]|nr:MAG: hypothetical protein EOP20_05920 [Hyphomicrobiales bacterium]